MTETQVKRPARLWVVGGLNIINGAVAIGALFVLAFGASVPDTLRPGPLIWTVSGGTALLLVVTSVLALCRIRRAQYAMLAIAVIFFGWMIEQNVQLLLAIKDLGGQVVQTQVFGTVARCVVMLGLNLWATLSRPTRDFMEAVPARSVP
jgi:hypothetical protein